MQAIKRWLQRFRRPVRPPPRARASSTGSRRGISSAGVRKTPSPTRPTRPSSRSSSRGQRDGLSRRSPAPVPAGQRYIELLELLMADLERYQYAQNEVAALDALIERRAIARKQYETTFQAIQTHAGEVLQAMNAEGRQSFLLPQQLAAGLKKYEELSGKANNAVMDSLYPERSDLHLVDHELRVASDRFQRYPTEPTRALIAQLQRRRGEFVRRNARRQPFEDALKKQIVFLRGDTSRVMRQPVNELTTARNDSDPMDPSTFQRQPRQTNKLSLPPAELKQLKKDWFLIKGELSLNYERHDSLQDSAARAKSIRKSLIKPEHEATDEALYAFNDEWFKECSEAFRKCEDAEARFKSIRDRAMKAGLAPVMILDKVDDAPDACRYRVPQDLGEFEQHQEDEELDSVGPEGETCRAARKREVDPKIENWREVVRNASVAADAVSLAPSGSPWDCSSVDLGEIRSEIYHWDGFNYGDGFTKAKKQCIREYRESQKSTTIH